MTEHRIEARADTASRLRSIENMLAALAVEAGAPENRWWFEADEELAEIVIRIFWRLDG